VPQTQAASLEHRCAACVAASRLVSGDADAALWRDEIARFSRWSPAAAGHCDAQDERKLNRGRRVCVGNTPQQQLDGQLGPTLGAVSSPVATKSVRVTLPAALSSPSARTSLGNRTGSGAYSVNSSSPPMSPSGGPAVPLTERETRFELFSR
jgi:hypothetical protein